MPTKKWFEPLEVWRIDEGLTVEDNLFEQILFHVAIDTMLRSSNLLGLKRSDVEYPSGQIKKQFIIIQQKTGKPVTVTLMESTRRLLEQFIKSYHKSRSHHLFTKKRGGKAIHSNYFRRLVKK